ncbi:MAG: ribosomal RNA small subunit methyltransferase A [Candidatus Nealsonbacteria bacterium CG23_combo_of_CG06-09_8_20_14_all_39_17]|uniref:Ribosomal RNA small subunit methyltransferase A n=1 Tax=Candidatus Nealsonbacteria bacterium CG23_combo_of_CG06-09_8_20_14_all_39_17 TaxID=1974722 RepID=A0A2G9YTL2_9BACT|nr:MAG: ribosomal RNA small subunit methyltransferase A [Candidatus Nealsonbacteria bacterium CG23_combo_of_CG06-09_8_20_14_all_39_17]
MDISSKEGIKMLFNGKGIKPSKGLGQNFLIDEEIVEKMIKTADLKPSDTVLEIGPGAGTLTEKLAQKVKIVIAVEKDPKMAGVLRETIGKSKNVEIIEEDILKIFNFQFSIFNKFLISNYKIIANLPFYLTSPVIRMFLEAENPPTEMTLIIQKEVAQRICSNPPDMSILAVSVQIYSKPETICYIPKEYFWPQPKVDCAIIKIIPLINANKKLTNTDTKQFFRIVKTGFSHPRKQLINNLKQLKLSREEIEKWLSANGINPTQRAETLTVDQWINLLKTFPHKISANQLDPKF